MLNQRFCIENGAIRIPAVLWGEPSDRLLIAVHGMMGNKEDPAIAVVAEKAVEKGYCVLSFDLPEHGERSEEDYSIVPWNCVSDLNAVYEYAGSMADEISAFGCSLGAYLVLLAFHEYPITQSLFLCPIVNMERLIRRMMSAFGVDEQTLEAEREIALPTGESLNWDEYCYVKKHPVSFAWSAPTTVLYGRRDSLIPWEDIADFADTYHAVVRVVEAEHYFHTESDMGEIAAWAEEGLAMVSVDRR